tara:strand:+ start:1583 stop:2134 length:552 start_codon:yes stop_codon:yes gene_type:complete
MTKKEISYADLVTHTMDKARAEAKKLGKNFDNKAAISDAAKRWAYIKSGSDPEFSKGESSKKPRKSRKKNKKPKKGHKGAESITRPGHKDFRTAKGFKYYHRDGHIEDYNEEGVKGRPYSHYNKHLKSAADVLKVMDHCLEKDMSLQECRDKVSAMISKGKTAKRGKKGKKKTRKKRGKKDRT